MSQFDLPRLNFSGRFSTDPATGNNNMHHPLIIFNPITGKAFFPPRIYFGPECIPANSSLEKVLALIPDGVELKTDTDPIFPGKNFIEISVINSHHKFIEWARTPLGKWQADHEFHDLYEALFAPVLKSRLTGVIAGYWNYYGTNYYHLHDVRVKSVTMEDNEKPQIFYGTETNCPKSILPYINARLTYNAVAEDDSTNSAKMVDTLPVMNVYSQIFSDWLTLYKDDRIFFKGHPNKGSVRQVNVFRVINENMPYSGAGKIITTIPLESLQKKEHSILIAFFRKYGDRKKKIQGIYIQQILSEVEERRPMDYENLGNVSNPAFGTISGVIAPWYEGEMKSWTIARQLIGNQPFITNKSAEYDVPVSLLSPAVFQISPTAGRIDIDFSVNIAMKNSKGEGPIKADPYQINSYETHDIGSLELVFEKTDPHQDPVEQIPVGTLTINKELLPRQKVLNEGGIFSFFFDTSDKKNASLKEYGLAIYGWNDHGQKIKLMSESPVVMISDETGLYCSENDDPVKGYYSYSGEKEACKIRIFRFGERVTEETDVHILAYKMTLGGAEMEILPFRSAKYKDGDLISFPTHEPASTIYQFLPSKLDKIPPHCYPGLLVGSGFFVNVRVLPTYDFSIYLDPGHENYQGPVTFDILMKEIFCHYHVLYPTMNFSFHTWENRAMAKYLFDRIKLESWDKPWYMPISRDISESQRALIFSWINKVLETDDSKKNRSDSSMYDHPHLTHLTDSTFFRK